MHIVRKSMPVQEPEPEPVITLGQFLKDNLESPYSASRGLSEVIGHHYDICNAGKPVAYSYVDAEGNEGIVVLDEEYNDKAVEWAKMFEDAHPEYAQIAVHVKE